MKKVQITLYEFQELKESAKEVAIEEHGDFLDSLPVVYENDSGKTIKEYVIHEKEDIISSIEANEYLFFADGKMANVTHFTGSHPKSDDIELRFHGETFLIK